MCYSLSMKEYIQKTVGLTCSHNEELMPRKLQPKFIKHEPVEETEIRRKHAKVMLEFDMKLFKARY